MASQAAQIRATNVPGHVIATARAFGGFTLLLTKRHRILYASPLALTVLPHDQVTLQHPDLIAVADEAWASREHIARPYSLTTLGPFQQIVVQGAVVEGRWVLLSVTDRTEEMRAIAPRQDLVSSIGHELRTPMTSVGLIAQALHSCAGDPAAVEHFAHRLDLVAQRLEPLADEMLTLTGASPLATHQSPVKVGDLVSRAVFQAMETARIKGVKLKTKQRVDATVIGDEAELVTALENLISNAIHYSAKGSRVVVSSQMDAAEGTVSIDVIDQGIGIADAEQERIFERFYRTDQARLRRAGGTGLGLAIVKRTALSHGGSVGVVSQLGSGSTFTLTLPIAPADPVTP